MLKIKVSREFLWTLGASLIWFGFGFQCGQAKVYDKWENSLDMELEQLQEQLEKRRAPKKSETIFI